MPTPSEGRALLFVAAVAALGLGVRGWRAIEGADVAASDREALARQIAAVDSAVTSGGRRRPSRASDRGEAGRSTGSAGSTGGSARAVRPAPTAAGPGPPGASAPPIDLDRASAAELDELPGIGPALAARIVAERELHGPFGSLEALQEVKGIGPALAARLAPRVSFSGPPRPLPARSPARGTRRP